MIISVHSVTFNTNKMIITRYISIRGNNYYNRQNALCYKNMSCLIYLNLFRNNIRRESVMYLMNLAKRLFSTSIISAETTRTDVTMNIDYYYDVLLAEERANKTFV